MQTFLPYPDFRLSAAALDDRRLGKQRVETLQVMKALILPRYGWQNHPVTAMWRGYRAALMVYQQATCEEWVGRGFADTCLEKTAAELAVIIEDAASVRRGDATMPPWLGRADLHRSHRSKLIAKAPEIYADRFPGTPRGLDYVWPGTIPRP